ncbi:TolB family protein [Nocardioides sp. MAHUQ-72]|uniref:TolB family protein n=1 Tax=unclassified Nocardioides TaxID=2615069 RepID=UPI00361D65C6
MGHHRFGRVVRWSAAFATGVALVAGSSAPAPAAYPGANGRIVFDTVWKFWNGTHDSSQIYSVRPDGSGLRRLTDEPGGVAAWHPAVSPDARRIAFVLTSPESNDQVWVMRADGSHQRLLADEPAWADTGPSFTADGRRVLYSRCGSYVAVYFTCKVVSVRLDGSGRRTVIGGLWHPTDPVMSPDGSTIAFVSDAGGYDGRVWLADADGRHQRPLGPKIAPERLSWSPDGTDLVFTGFRDGNLYTVGVDGSGLRTVAPSTLFGAWSPDGSRIVSKRVDPRTDNGPLQTTDTGGDDPRRIVGPAFGAGYSDWGTKR